MYQSVAGVEGLSSNGAVSEPPPSKRELVTVCVLVIPVPKLTVLLPAEPELSILSPYHVVGPEMLWPPVPLKVTVPVPGVKVPLFVQSPLTIMA